MIPITAATITYFLIALGFYVGMAEDKDELEVLPLVFALIWPIMVPVKLGALLGRPLE